MSDCNNIPTLALIEEYKRNIDTSNEFVKSVMDFMTDQYGAKRLTLTGIESKYEEAESNRDKTFDAQFAYKHIKSFAEANAAGEKITDATRLNAYSIGTAPNLEWYGLIQSTTIPSGGLNIPSTPDDNWTLVSAVKLTQMRTDSASQLGLFYDKDWFSGIVIESGAMTAKKAIWHDGQFYSVGTDTGFTSNDFNSDLTNGRFIDESITSHQRLLRYNGDVSGWSTIAQAINGCISNGSVMTAKNGVYPQLDTMQIPTGLDFAGSNMKNTRFDFSSSSLTPNDYMLEIHHDDNPRSTETMSNVSNMTLIGNKSSNGLSLSNRHWCSVKNFNIEDIGSGTGYYMTNAWLNEFSNLRVFTCGIGFLFGQDCNAVTLTRCGTENTSIACVKTITENNRGSTGLSFYGCDFEFGSGHAIWNTSENILDFHGCYIGEYISDSVFRNDGNGQCNVNGGVVFFGGDPNPDAYLVEGSGVKFKGVHVINMDSTANISYSKLFKKHRDGDSAGSSIGTTFEDCDIASGVSGTVDGDPLGYGSGSSQCETQGYKFTQGYGGIPVTRNQNAGRVTSQDPTGAFGMKGEINKDWVMGGEALLIVVYRSTVGAGISVSQNLGNGGEFLSLGYMPPTAGELKTYINPQSSTPDFTKTQVVNQLEIIADAGTRIGAGDYIEIAECYYVDNRVRGTGWGSVRNLYKMNQPFIKGA